MNNQGISPKEIIETVGREGLTVSNAQLHRWQRRGLIPRPKVRGLGRGQGTTSFYPADTAQQVIALCELLTEDRRLNLSALALFFQGYPIRVELLKSILTIAADQWKKTAGNLINDTGLTPEGTDALQKMVFDRLKPSPITRARGRLRKSKFETFIRVLIFVSAGKPPDYLEDIDEPTAELSILKKGLGIEAALKTWLKVDNDELQSAINSLTVHFNQAALLATIREADDDELITTGAELLIVWQTFMDLKACFLVLDEKNGLGLRGLPNINFTHPTTLAPMMFLIWLHLRKMPEIAVNIPEIIASATKVSTLRNLFDSHPRLVKQLIKPMKIGSRSDRTSIA